MAKYGDNPEFMQRVKEIQDGDPVNYIQNSDGSVSTHKMASGELDGKQIVFPTIVNQDGKLTELSPKDAFRYAIKNNEYKEFSSPGDKYVQSLSDIDQARAESFAEGSWKPKQKGSDMAKYKTKDTDPEVTSADDTEVKLADKMGSEINPEDQTPEFQSHYADYKARMSKQKGAVVASPTEYYKILSAMAHAGAMRKKSQPAQPQQQAPASAGGAYSADADTALQDVKRRY